MRCTPLFVCGVLLLASSGLGLESVCAQDNGRPTERRSLPFAAPGSDALSSLWAVPTPGWRVELVEAQPASAARPVKLCRSEDKGAPFGNLMCYLDATDFAGSKVRLTARIRVEGDGAARGQMWLRADCANDTMGAFDNMHDRPVLASAANSGWTDATIELDIEPDAHHLAIGVMAMEGATVFVDAMAIERRGNLPPPQPASAPAELSERALLNAAAAARLLGHVRFFHPSDEAVRVKAWGHVAIHVLEAAEPAVDAADLAQRLQQAFAPLAPTLAVWAGNESQAPALPARPDGAVARRHWHHFGAGSIAARGGNNIYRSEVKRERVRPGEAASQHQACFVTKSLGGGVCCRLPVRVYADEKHTLPHTATSELVTAWQAPATLPKLTAMNRATRLANVALCWGVMQHFYPYFDVVQADWDAALLAALRQAAVDRDERAHLFTLRALIAQLHDGHGIVYKSELTASTVLPVEFTFAGDALVVAAQPAGDTKVRRGDVVLAIDGKPVGDCLAEIGRSISAATPGWRQAMTLQKLRTHFAGAERVALRLRHLDGTELETTIACVAPDAKNAPEPPRRMPDNGSQVAPGIVYFDLHGAEDKALEQCLPALAAAKGIVFDLRGYPGSAGATLMGHLIDDDATSARWNVPIVTEPDRAHWTWETSGRWQIKPRTPRLRGAVAFLTGGGAISYAESVMGIVEHYKLGEIVGEPTAGTNGNVNPFELPGGYHVSWTGMQVLKHDGSQHHGVGIRPTVPVSPTPQGIADGRDEVLERAIAVLQGKLAAPPGGK